MVTERGSADFLFVEEAIATVAALEAARNLGLLDCLEEGPARPTELASTCGTDLRATARLMDALAEIGVVRRGHDGVYEARPPLTGLVRHLTPWDRLVDAVRSGTPAIELDEPAVAEVAYAESLGFVGDLLDSAAREVADLLDVKAGARVLDVGAGCAPWTIAMARADPTCRVTALDFPKVLALTEAAVTTADCRDQFDMHSGDAFSTTIEENHYDLVITANVCHLYGDAGNRRLLARLSSAIRPGGRVAIIDFIGGGTGTTSRWIALYSLGLIQRTTAGGAHRLAEYREWLEDAGLQALESVTLRSMPLSILVAHRPR